jgi:flagellar protein FliS
MYNAVQQYKRVETHSSVFEADPHRLIQMLLQGALDKIALAKGFIQRGDVAEKGRHISWGISIIEGLRTSLDHEKGGEIAENLNGLYQYMERRLLEANLRSDPAILDEVSGLVRDIRDAWNTIRAEVQP